VPACLSALTRCLVPVDRRPDTVVGCLGPIRCRTFAVTLGPQQNVLPSRLRVVLEIVQTSQPVASVRTAIAKHGSSITIVRRSPSRCGTLVAQTGHGVTVATRLLPRQRASVIRGCIATGSEIVVGCVLILVRASLIAVALRLVVIRPDLILVTRRLVEIRPRLVEITRRAVAVAHVVSRRSTHP
jgi:hypothetical protein